MENKPKNAPRQARGGAYWQALNLAWEFGYLIVVPLVLFALGGRYADKVFGTTPWLFLTGMGLSIGLTTFLLIKKFSSLMADVSRESKKQ